MREQEVYIAMKSHETQEILRDMYDAVSASMEFEVSAGAKTQQSTI